MIDSDVIHSIENIFIDTSVLLSISDRCLKTAQLTLGWLYKKSDANLTEKERDILLQVVAALNIDLAEMRRDVENIRFYNNYLDRSIRNGETKSKTTQL